MALRLARAGYWGGDPQNVLNADTEMVVLAMQYENFRDEYERTFIELNRDKERA